MNYTIDTEFDGFNGPLVSLALVREDGEARYWVLPHDITCDWCKVNMQPFIFEGPYEKVASEADLSREIHRFLKKDDDINLYADWPDDFKYFCDVMVFGPGKCRGLTAFKMHFDRKYGSYSSKVPHNAYYDALAIMENIK